MLKRYFVVTLIFAFWCTFNFFMDGLSDFWILFTPIFLLSLVCVATYLVIGLVISIVKRDFWHSLSVLLGPVAAVIVAHLAASFAGSLGLTPDHLLFSKRRDEFSARVANQSGDQTLVVGSLRASGFFTACTSATLVVHDPGHRIGLPPAQRTDEWKRRMAQITENTRCGSSPVRVTVTRLEGDFYAVRLE